MTGRKLVLLGILGLVGVLTFETDAQAGRRKRRNRDCNTCAVAAPCDACGAQGYAGAGSGVPLNMPSGTVIPGEDVALGSRIPPTNTTPGGAVIPAGGFVPSTDSYYFDPRTGTYYPRTGPGGYADSYTMPVTSTGRRIGRIFRR